MSQPEATTPITQKTRSVAADGVAEPMSSPARTAAERSVTVKKPATRAKSTATTGTRRRTARTAAAPTLQVKQGEAPWSGAELDDIAGVLRTEQERLVSELFGIQAGVQQLMSAGGEGSGDDDADIGVKSSNREQEFTVAQNSRRLLAEVELALTALADGTYGTCESCSEPIGKLRLQARPRTTLCMACKQRQERH